MRFPRLTWFASLPAGMFYCLTALGVHDAIGAPGGLPGTASLLANVLFSMLVALWVIRDARQHRRSLPYDFDSLVFFTWPILVPIYLFATRGMRGFIWVGRFLLIYIFASLTTWVLSFVAILL